MFDVSPDGYSFRFLRRVALALTVLTLVTSSPQGLQAQEAMRIVAVVNDEMISGYDLDQRIRLVTGGAGLPKAPEQRNRLISQVLRSMVDERLQMQEAKRLNIRVEPRELNEALGRIATQNNVPPDQLTERLKAEGMSIETLEAQIEANLAWNQVVRRRGARFTAVSEDEINEALARVKESAMKPSQLVSHIFLSVDSPQEENQILNNARRLIEELRAGASFPALASQYSQDPSARAGGDMGWLQAGQLPQEVEKVLAEMPVGAVSSPIRSPEGYHIVAVRNRREPAASASEDDVQVSLHQIIVPFQPGMRQADIANQTELAQTISETVSGCDDLDKAAREMGSAVSGGAGLFRVGEMAAPLRRVVLDLKVGQASKPLVNDEGLRIIMVCERKDPPSSTPSRQDVQRMLIEQKMEMQSRRFLRDLRQTAIVDIRA